MFISRLTAKIAGLYRVYIERRLNQRHSYDYPDVCNGWIKVGHGPVFGDRSMVSVFDPYVYLEDDVFVMLASERKHDGIISVKSKDGIKWTDVKVILKRIPDSWEERVNRACYLKVGCRELLWYTGQDYKRASIGLAIKNNSGDFIRVKDNPIIEADLPFEGTSVMNPCVIWNESKQKFQMWYSAGEIYEPDVICYAESDDGIIWLKHDKPVLEKLRTHEWEKYKVGGCHVSLKQGSYTIFYIGYQNLDVARVCFASSQNGIDWTRTSNNLILSPTKGAWDEDAVYKPSVVQIGSRYYMWYNGRSGNEEFIGLAMKII